MDRGLRDFESRLGRIEKIHEAGGAFEANGALGRSYFDSVRPRPARHIPWRGLALVLSGVILLKATLLGQIGAEAYGERVNSLAAGNIGEKTLGWILEAGPLTQKLAGFIQSVLY
ncbi:hypothetical protein [Pseudothioclava nitratireducens]|uniref:hypothetical protein n=1 Tax=Pseudothioclava nitratireducens TaxID=1928646 RepID=UPI0023DA7CFD|nr:hypothetical protein [Defluviimonas nitratireducens]MDF1619723.1 hypothetical protein [Defluviimonas nitratireducens]